MKIVLDTNILFDKWFLAGPQFELLQRHAASGRSTVFIPSMAVLELQNRYFKRVSEYISAAQKLNHVLPPGYATLSLPSPNTLVDAKILARFDQIGMKFLG
jgi:hypothetical protein